MEHHQPIFSGTRPHTRRSQRAGVADGGVEAERAQRGVGSTIALSRANGHHLPHLLTGRADAAHSLKVNLEVLFGKLSLAPPARHLRYQLPPRIRERLTGVAISVCTVAHRLLYHSIG